MKRVRGKCLLWEIVRRTHFRESNLHGIARRRVFLFFLFFTPRVSQRRVDARRHLAIEQIAFVFPVQVLKFSPLRTQFRSLATLRNRIKQARKSVSRCHDGKSMTPGGAHGPIYVRGRTIFVNFATNGSRRSGVSCCSKRCVRLNGARLSFLGSSENVSPRYFRASDCKAELS